jgi:hypothetical protein
VVSGSSIEQKATPVVEGSRQGNTPMNALAMAAMLNHSHCWLTKASLAPNF